jgi:hypothetical protein
MTYPNRISVKTRVIGSQTLLEIGASLGHPRMKERMSSMNFALKRTVPNFSIDFLS